MSSWFPLYQWYQADKAFKEKVMADIATLIADAEAMQTAMHANDALLTQLVTDAQSIDTKMDTILTEIANLKAGGGVATQAQLDQLEAIVQDAKTDVASQTTAIDAVQKAHAETLTKEGQA